MPTSTNSTSSFTEHGVDDPSGESPDSARKPPSPGGPADMKLQTLEGRAARLGRLLEGRRKLLVLSHTNPDPDVTYFYYVVLAR